MSPTSAQAAAHLLWKGALPEEVGAKVEVSGAAERMEVSVGGERWVVTLP